MRKVKVVELLANYVNARKNGFDGSFLKGEVKDYLPHGSGIDVHPELDEDKSNINKLVIHGNYHTMNDHGYYTGWKPYTITVTPSFIGAIDMRISIQGRGALMEDLKDHLYETFYWSLCEEVTM